MFKIGDDTIDSREIIQRIKDLEKAVKDESMTRMEQEELEEELEELKALVEEVSSDCVDWEFGATLICERHFEDYVREAVEESHPEVLDLPHWVEIDWRTTADNVQQDYSCAYIGAYTYWYRSV